MIFVPWHYHIKNNTLSEGFVIPMMFLNQWRLPLLFVISGMGTCFALSYKTGKKFLWERTLRLLVPIVFGMLLLVPPQVYVERLSQGVNYKSYLDFYVHLFNGAYPQGNLSWHHLWFIVYLFFYTLLLTPIFIYIRRHPNHRVIELLKISLQKYPFILFLFPIPLIIIESILYPKYGYTLSFWRDWYTLSFYGVLFLYGFLLISIKDIFWNILEKYRFYFFIIALVLTTTFFVLLQTNYQLWIYVVRLYNLWTWILLLLGYSAKYLNKPSIILTYRNEAVYPFYILHHTVLLILGYYIIQLNLNITFKFLILAIGTFGIVWLIYELFIRKYTVLRFLFGMKIHRQKNNSLNKKEPIIHS